MAVLVVGRLQPIDVDETQDQRFLLPLGPGNLPVDLQEPGPPQKHAGEVIKRCVGPLPLEAPRSACAVLRSLAAEVRSDAPDPRSAEAVLRSATAEFRSPAPALRSEDACRRSVAASFLTVAASGGRLPAVISDLVAARSRRSAI